jgi:hypothetical protein
MKDEARSAKVYKSQAHVSLIDRYPPLGNFLLLLSLVSLFGLSVFLLSDILSIGEDASHKGLFDGFNSEKNIAEFTGMMNQKYNDMKVLLGFKPVGGLSNPGYSNSSAGTNGTLLTASGVLNGVKNRSSSLSSLPASSANISKRASSGSRYAIPIHFLGDDSSSEESTPPKKLGAASGKNTNQNSPGINQSRLGMPSIDDLRPAKSQLYNSEFINIRKNQSILNQPELNQTLLNKTESNRKIHRSANGSQTILKDKRKESSDISKDNASLSNVPFALSDISSDNYTADFISPEKASLNLTATHSADHSGVRALEFGLASKDKVKGSSKIAVQAKNKINSRSKAPSKLKDGKSIQSNKRIRAVRSPQKMIPPNRPKNSKRSSR